MAILEGEQMKKQNVGFAFLLLGVIFALAGKVGLVKVDYIPFENWYLVEYRKEI